MTPAMMTRLFITVMLFDTLGVLLSVVLSVHFHGAIFDLGTWMLTFVPFCILGTGLGVWMAVRQLRG